MCGASALLRPRAHGVELDAVRGFHRRANLWLRSASRVFVRAATFPRVGPRDVLSRLRASPLDPFLGSRRPLRVEVVGQVRSLDERRALAGAWGAAGRPGRDDDGSGPEVRVEVGAREVTVWIDTSGELLHQRGYRQEVGRAPLRESIAAAMLLSAGYKGDEPLWDPMCGSGTVAIEAAWLALGRAPGLSRRFAFEAFPSLDKPAWENERDSALAAVRPKPGKPIWATDLNAGALGTARRNARRAGVLSHLSLERRDALTLHPGGVGEGLVATNLPYGVRVGERRAMNKLYADFAGVLRQAFAGWRYALLASAEVPLPLEPERTLPLDNGGIPCCLVIGKNPVPGT